jgi:hypothetical protein
VLSTGLRRPQKSQFFGFFLKMGVKNGLKLDGRGFICWFLDAGELADRT